MAAKEKEAAVKQTFTFSAAFRSKYLMESDVEPVGARLRDDVGSLQRNTNGERQGLLKEKRKTKR